jgi:hypothetical protein
MAGSQYSGIPHVARRYWQDYFSAALAMAAVLVFTGSVGAVVVYTFLPEGVDFFLLSAISLTLHSAGMYLKDTWSDEYDPDQTQFSSSTQIFAMIVLVGVFESTLLLISAVGAVAFTMIPQVPSIVPILFAAYYSVSDLILVRRGYRTPAAFVLIGAALVLQTVFNIHRATVDMLPVIGKRRRPS